jgi:hypothetical protein
MIRIFLFLVVTYGGVMLLLLLQKGLEKKSIRLTGNELQSIALKSVGYGTVMLLAAYAYYFLGIETR